MRHALLIAARDLRERARDRTLHVLAIVLPLGLAGIFTLILGDISGDSPMFTFAVADSDGGVVATTFTGEVLERAAASGAIRLRTAASEQEARTLVGDGTATAAFLLPEGLTEAVRTGGAARIEVVGNVDAPTGTDIARSLAQAYADRLLAIRTAVAATVRSGVPTPPAELASAAAAALPQAAVVEDTTGRRQLDAKTQYAAGMAVFFLFFAVQPGVTGLLDERRDGTLARLLAAPVRRTSILAGKLLTGVVVGLVSTALLVVASSVLMGARWGHPAGVALLVVAGVLAATGAMAVVAAIARTSEQAGGWQAITAIVLGALGGAFFPVSQAGGVLDAISLVSPHRWFLRGLADLAGGDVAAVLPPVAVLSFFAALTGGLALLLFRKVVRP
ncbi:ABC transporter permease [Lentzea albida]|uniref:ABC-2 type transport system permease protein n=1 Tax=Lentzea albida TaxID=65499 RepID=A0A1H9RBW1_9PSEU|nr:ABC transporter permease [Lentzea albida]SER70148.1 ABC-2 type transport system permease protein [Lentzea albida]